MSGVKFISVLFVLCLFFIFSPSRALAQSCSGGTNYVDYSCNYDLIDDKYECVSNGGMYISCAGSPCEAFGPVFCFPHDSGCTISSYGDGGVCSSNDPSECGSNCSTRTSACGGGGCASNQVLVTETCDGNGDGVSTQCNSYCRNEPTCTSGECTSNCSTNTGACGSGSCLSTQRYRETRCDGNGDGNFTTCSSVCVSDPSCNPDPDPKYSCDSTTCVCTEDPNGTLDSCASCTGCAQEGYFCGNDRSCHSGCTLGTPGCSSLSDCQSGCTPGFRGGCDYLLHPDGICGLGYRSLCDAARVPGAYGSGDCNLEASAITLPDASTDQVKFDFRCTNGWGYTGINGSCSESTSYMRGLAILKNSEGSNASISGGQQYKDHDWAFIGTLPNGQSSITLSDRTGFTPGTNTYKVLPRCAIRKDESRDVDKYGYKRIPNDLFTQSEINRCQRDYRPCYSIEPPVPILSGPSSVCSGVNNTYAIYASDSCPFTKVEVWMSPASPVNAGGDWTLLNTVDNINSNSYSGIFTTSFSMDQDYWLVANAYDSTYQCSGNPFLSDSELAAVGFSNCGDSSRILVSPISVIRDDPNDPNDGISNLGFVSDLNDKSKGVFSWNNTTPVSTSDSFYLRRFNQTTGVEENSTISNIGTGAVSCDNISCSVDLYGLACPNNNYLYGVGISNACNTAILSNYIKPNDNCTNPPTVSVTVEPPENGKPNCEGVTGFALFSCINNNLGYTKYYSDLVYYAQTNISDIDSYSIAYDFSTNLGSFPSAYSFSQSASLISPTLPGNFNVEMGWSPGTGYGQVYNNSTVTVNVTDDTGNTSSATSLPVQTSRPESNLNVEVKHTNKPVSSSFDTTEFCTDSGFQTNPKLKNFNANINQNGKKESLSINLVPQGTLTPSESYTLDITNNFIQSRKRLEFSGLLERTNSNYYNLSVTPDFDDPGYNVLCIRDLDNGTTTTRNPTALLENTTREGTRNFRAVVGQQPPKGWLQAVGGNIFTGTDVDYDLPYDTSVVDSHFVNNIFNLSNTTVTSGGSPITTNTYSGVSDGFVVSNGNIRSSSGSVGAIGIAKSGSFVQNCNDCASGLADYITYLQNNLTTQTLNVIPFFSTNFWWVYYSGGAFSTNLTEITGSNRLFVGGNTGTIFVLFSGDLVIRDDLIQVFNDARSSVILVVPGNVTIEKDVQRLEATLLVGGTTTIEGAQINEPDFEKDLPLITRGSIYSVGGINANRSTAQKDETEAPVNGHDYNGRPVETFIFQPQMFLGDSPAESGSSNIYLRDLN